ncbi:MAG: nucleotidyltransferase domain-containing protein [Pseudomonadota bacterium]
MSGAAPATFDREAELARFLPRLIARSAQKIILFGSLARGTAGPRSDVDLLVVGQPGDVVPAHDRVDPGPGDLAGQDSSTTRARVGSTPRRAWISVTGGIVVLGGPS